MSLLLGPCDLRHLHGGISCTPAQQSFPVDISSRASGPVSGHTYIRRPVFVVSFNRAEAFAWSFGETPIKRPMVRTRANQDPDLTRPRPSILSSPHHLIHKNHCLQQTADHPDPSSSILMVGTVFRAPLATWTSSPLPPFGAVGHHTLGVCLQIDTPKCVQGQKTIPRAKKKTPQQYVRLVWGVLNLKRREANIEPFSRLIKRAGLTGVRCTGQHLWTRFIAIEKHAVASVSAMRRIGSPERLFFRQDGLLKITPRKKKSCKNDLSRASAPL